MQQQYNSLESIDFGIQELPRKYVPYSNTNTNGNATSFVEEPEVSYDDILDALNVKLHQGKLQALSREEKKANMRAATVAASPSRSPSFKGQPRIPRVPIRNGLASKQYAPPPPPQKVLHNNNPHLQNSYIHNKYFKDFIKEETTPVRPLKPMTRVEYLAQLKKKDFEDARQRHRIRQVKSKKLLFNNGGNTNIYINTHNNNGIWNKMFQLKGV